MKTAPAAPLQESTTTPPFFSVRFDSDNTSLSVSAQKPPNQNGGATKKRRPRRRRPKDVIEATTPPATTQTWLNMQQLDSVGFYGSPSPIFSSCKNPQWVCYGDFITIKLPNYSSGDYWYGPWWTVHSMNLQAELGLNGSDLSSMNNPTYYSCWNSYSVFLTPYYYSGGYDHNSTSVGVFQIIPYGASSSTPCAPGTSPLCTKNSWYGQPVVSGDTIYLQWNLICTNNNPNYCEVPYCWDNIGSNVARVAWYSNTSIGVKDWPLYISQYYAFSDSTNTGTGNSCLIYDMQQIVNVKNTGNSNPDNQVYMNNSSWDNDEQTLFIVTGTSGKNLVYGGSVTFAPYNLSGYNVVSMSVADVVAGRATSADIYNTVLPNQFDTQLTISKNSATEFQIMPAVNPLVTTSPTQTLYCFASPSACTGDKPNCGHGTPGCVGTTWTCPGDLVACSCAMGMCTPGGLCVTPAGVAPTKTIDSATGKCTYSCAKSSQTQYQEPMPQKSPTLVGLHKQDTTPQTQQVPPKKSNNKQESLKKSNTLQESLKSTQQLVSQRNNTQQLMSQKQKRQTQPYLNICLDHLEHVNNWEHIGCRIVTDRDECVKYLVHECLEKYKDISELAYSHHFHDDGRRNKMLSVIMSDSLNLIKQIENQDVVNDETLQRVRDLVNNNAKYHFNSYLQSSL